MNEYHNSQSGFWQDTINCIACLKRRITTVMSIMTVTTITMIITVITVITIMKVMTVTNGLKMLINAVENDQNRRLPDRYRRLRALWTR
jgi:hypothetical protein